MPSFLEVAGRNSDACDVCGEEDYEETFGPRMTLICACGRGRHVSCDGARAPSSAEEAEEVWACSDACRKVAADLEKLDEERRRVLEDGSFLEVAKYEENNTKGVNYKKLSEREKQARVATYSALKLFRSAFNPLLLDDGRDMLQLVCKRCVDDVYDFSDFRVVVLRKAGTIVSAATIRIFGDGFCEVPFIATREGFRREGNCKQLFEAMTDLVRGMGVHYLVLPSVEPLVGMWHRKFGMQVMTRDEIEAVNDKIVEPEDPNLLKLRLSDDTSEEIQREAEKAKAEEAEKQREEAEKQRQEAETKKADAKKRRTEANKKRKATAMAEAAAAGGEKKAKIPAPCKKRVTFGAYVAPPDAPVPVPREPAKDEPPFTFIGLLAGDNAVYPDIEGYVRSRTPAEEGRDGKMAQEIADAVGALPLRTARAEAARSLQCQLAAEAQAEILMAVCAEQEELVLAQDQALISLAQEVERLRAEVAAKGGAEEGAASPTASMEEAARGGQPSPRPRPAAPSLPGDSPAPTSAGGSAPAACATPSTDGASPAPASDFASQDAADALPPADFTSPPPPPEDDPAFRTPPGLASDVPVALASGGGVVESPREGAALELVRLQEQIHCALGFTEAQEGATGFDESTEHGTFVMAMEECLRDFFAQACRVQEKIEQLW